MVEQVALSVWKAADNLSVSRWCSSTAFSLNPALSASVFVYKPFFRVRLFVAEVGNDGGIGIHSGVHGYMPCLGPVYQYVDII
jgi:hypothetical protein